MAQFTDAPRLERSVSNSRVTVSVPYTTEELLVELDEDVYSEWVSVRDLLTGTPLQFRIHLARGGFFHLLEGRAQTVWPKRWAVSRIEVEAAAHGALKLPEDFGGSCLELLTEWLGTPERYRSLRIHCRAPASESEIDELEARESSSLAPAIRKLITISNGLDVGSLLFFGTKDLFTVKLSSKRYWVVATEEEVRYLVPCGLGQVFVVPEPDSEPVPHTSSFERWLAGRLNISGPDDDYKQPPT